CSIDYFFLSFFFSIIPSPPRSTLFPYTTLFRSGYGAIPVSSLRGLRSNKCPTPGGTRGIVVSSHVSRCEHEPSQGNPLASSGFPDRKSTRLNSSHVAISYAVFCLKKKKTQTKDQ